MSQSENELCCTSLSEMRESVCDPVLHAFTWLDGIRDRSLVSRRTARLVRRDATATRGAMPPAPRDAPPTAMRMRRCPWRVF